jgi:hypothetical protein
MHMKSVCRTVGMAVLVAGFISCRRGSAPDAKQARQREAPQTLEFVAAGIPLRVVVSQESDSDYKAVFYRRTETRVARFGPDVELLGFRRPFLTTGASQVVRAQHVQSGEWFYFKVTADGVELVPEHGRWETLQSGAAVHVPPVARDAVK